VTKQNDGKVNSRAKYFKAVCTQTDFVKKLGEKLLAGFVRS